MRNGFIFNTDRCVNCKACSAACLLENGWSVPARSIFTYNQGLLAYIPVTHLSLACNHCKKPLCLEGCPTGAYFKDPSTSAIIIESKKCIGCRYCVWNCPYDAPKTNMLKGFMEKCNFCYIRIKEGVEPACTSACPTGALKYGEVPETSDKVILNWFPDKNINPALQITGSKDQIPLKIYPEMPCENQQSKIPDIFKSFSGEWSLILFSFLTTLSVSFSITKLFGSIFPGTGILICLLIVAGIFSLFHLRIKVKAPAAILNVRNSPLSREILLFLIFSIITISSLILKNNILLVSSAMIGLLLLMGIDNVYTYADRSVKMIFHSGQTFLTGLLISSFLIKSVVPFVFLASIKVIFNLYSLFRDKPEHSVYSLRIFRVAILLIITGAMISGIRNEEVAVITLFLSGELADRLLYYADFKPLNIKSEMSEFLITSRNEKE
jgi:anaerobic dimethyl sulfoxide reductase subunit B (iron-sulfur subunit)